MITSLLLIIIVGALSLAVAGVVLSETKPTQAARKDVGTLNAASSGFEVALHRLRAATDAAGNGIRGQLPCTMTDRTLGTRLTGSVGPNSGSFTYDVYVRYYFSDPTNQTTTWLRDNTIACSGSAPVAVPQFAYLQSSGQGAAIGGASANQGDRNLHTTYTFRTSNYNVAGGRLQENGTTLCMDVGTSPAVGSPVYVKSCQPVGTQSQSWSYRADLTLYYTGSGSPGLCLNDGTATAGTALKLQTCLTAGSNYPYSPSASQAQEWSFDDNGKFEGAGSSGDINGRCIAPNSSGPISGAQLYLQTCSGGGFDYMTWNPDPQVGAGPAGDVTQQLVNYYEFGRCLDVTDQTVSRTWLIDYPCKQAPDSSKITWNQRWLYKSDGAGYKTFVTYNGGSASSPYCLTSPASGNQVTTTTCDGSARQRWTKTGEVAGDYGSSYQILNSAGQCLSLAAGQGDTYHQQFATIIVETCSGQLRQKWNAPANFIDSRLKNTVEDQGG